MKYSVLLTGVGGEGVLTVSAILAKAANIDGYFVRGSQLHGLAQRGGAISASVIFGDEKEVFSPLITHAGADLIIAFEPLEAVRAVRYAGKGKTAFIIDDDVQVPVCAVFLGKEYPLMNEITEKISLFSKALGVFNTKDISNKNFGETIFKNMILLGIAFGAGLIPLKEQSLQESIKESVPRDTEKNLQAFNLGKSIGKDSMR